MTPICTVMSHAMMIMRLNLSRLDRFAFTCIRILICANSPLSLRELQLLISRRPRTARRRERRGQTQNEIIYPLALTFFCFLFISFSFDFVLCFSMTPPLQPSTATPLRSSFLLLLIACTMITRCLHVHFAVSVLCFHC